MDEQRRLARLRDLPLNYDPEAPHPAEDGWRVDDYCQPLPAEPPGEPVAGGPFQVAQRLLRDYKVADPKLVRVTYDHAAPLEHRDMLLELRFHGLFSVFAGCRVGTVTDEARTEDGRPVRVWGWPYMTLEGHVEQGQMDWEVWKWLDTGEVQFRIRSISRNAGTRTLLINLGFRLFGQRERERYLAGACRRMAGMTAAALRGEQPAARWARPKVPPG